VEKENKWFCTPCGEKKEEVRIPEPNPQPEGKFILILIMLTYFFVIKILCAQRLNSSHSEN